MALTKVNWQLRTSSLPFIIKDFAPDYGVENNPASKDPRLAAHYVDGEWARIVTGQKLSRVANGVAKATAPLTPLYPIYAENGRVDTQYLEKIPVIFMGEHEADTTVVLDGDKATFALGDRLVVIEGAIPGETGFLKYSCLAIADGGVGAYTGKGGVVGYVAAPYDTKTGLLRVFVKPGLPISMTAGT